MHSFASNGTEYDKGKPSRPIRDGFSVVMKGELQ